MSTELAVTLKKVVDKHGLKTIYDGTIVGLLADYCEVDRNSIYIRMLKFWRDQPELMHRIYQALTNKDELELDNLKETVTNSLCLERTRVEYIFDCFGYACGLTSQKPIDKTGNTTTSQPSSSSTTPVGIQIPPLNIPKPASPSPSRKVTTHTTTYKPKQSPTPTIHFPAPSSPQAITPSYPTNSWTSFNLTPWYKKWQIWAGGVAIALACICMAIYGRNSISKEQDMMPNTTLTIDANDIDIEGNYTLREEFATTAVNGIRTAAIKKTSDTKAQILVTSEYGPEIYGFTLEPNGKIYSDQLGEGELTYNEKFNKTTLTFKQGERVCRFTK